MIAHHSNPDSESIVMTWNRTLGGWLVVLVFTCSLSGCATILSKRSYDVTVDNKGGPTYFAVRDWKNQVVESGVTPRQVTLDSSQRLFRPAKYKVDYATREGVHSRDLNAKVDPWIAGNIVIGGVPGLVVDGATGAMWRLDKRITGLVPSQMLVSNTEQGAAVLAGKPIAPGSTEGKAFNPNQPPGVRQASYGVQE